MNREKSKIVRQAKQDSKKADFLKAYDLSAGNVSTACKKANIHRSTFYTWQDDEDFKNAINEIDESIIDMAETSLKNEIRAGNTTAIIFFLKCKAKKRGYVEKVELTTDDESRIKIEIVDARTTS